MNEDIYLDGHATTPLAPEALEAMAPWWHAVAANSHSPHARGVRAAKAVEDARGQVADLIGSSPQELTFTSGATEANNLAIRGTALAALDGASPRRTIIVSAIEHKSVLAAAESLVRQGFRVVQAPVNRQGLVDVDQMRELVDEETLLVSVMAVNNEIGTIQPIDHIGNIARSAGALFHVDAAQAAGKTELDLSEIDLASLSAHKLYGPAGVGVLHVSSATPIRPTAQQFGGSQEGGLRPGTVPVPLVVGFGAAAALAKRRLPLDGEHAEALRASMLRQLSELQVTYVETIDTAQRVAGSISIRFPGYDSTSLIGRASRELSLSEGSACSSGQITQSHVLSAIGLTSEEAAETVRLFCSRYNTLEEMRHAASILKASLRE